MALSLISIAGRFLTRNKLVETQETDLKVNHPRSKLRLHFLLGLLCEGHSDLTRLLLVEDHGRVDGPPP